MTSTFSGFCQDKYENQTKKYELRVIVTILHLC